MTILISHRGNINGKNPQQENNPDYIDKTLKQGFNVEIDVWLKNGNYYLGHNEPAYFVDINWFKAKPLWCHAKNVEALPKLINDGLHCFWHQTDDVTLTNHYYLWTYPGKKLVDPGRSIAVLPERANWNLEQEKFAGICSDYIEKYK